MVTKDCRKCGINKSIEMFNKAGRTEKGSPRFKSWCKECTSESDKKYYQNLDIDRQRERASKGTDARAERYFNDVKIKVYNYLKENPCVDCGEDDILFLDFDHVRGQKLRGIGDMMARWYKWEVVSEEIDKCEVRCVRCHREVTAKRANWLILSYR